MPNQIAWGFLQLRDIFDHRVNDVGVDVINTAAQETLDEHQRQVDAISRLFVEPTTEYKIKFRSALTGRLQPLDEFGRARPRKGAAQYETGFPIQMAGDAWGANWLTRQKMTVGEANDTVMALVQGDLFWLRDHILAALYASTAWVFPDEDHGDLTIYGLANGDSTRYQIINGALAGTTDNHYLFQAAAIADATNPYPIIHTELTEHPENGGQNAVIVALVPTNLIAATEALTDFREMRDPDVSAGANESFLTGTLGVRVPGIVKGKTNKVWVVEWGALPNDRIVAVSIQGDRPLRMREDEEANLRGFRAVAEREDHPYWERQYVRRAGFGAWNRVGALVYQVGAGAYSVPTGFGSPMP